MFLFDRGHKGEKADKGNNGFLFEGEACVVSFCFLDCICMGGSVVLER